MKLTRTNRPTTYTTNTTPPFEGRCGKKRCVHYAVPKQQPRFTGHNTTTTQRVHATRTHKFPAPTPVGGRGTRVTAVTAWGKRPVPSRTRKLRPTAPMVLHPGGCGRVGHRRTTITGNPRPTVGGFRVKAENHSQPASCSTARCPRRPTLMSVPAIPGTKQRQHWRRGLRAQGSLPQEVSEITSEIPVWANEW